MRRRRINPAGVKAYVDRLQKDTSPIENKGVLIASAILQKSARSVILRRKPLSAVFKSLAEPLTQAAHVAFLTGVRREQLGAKRGDTVQASEFTDAVAYLARITGQRAQVSAKFRDKVTNALDDLEPSLQARLEPRIAKLIAEGAPTTTAVAELVDDFNELASHQLETVFRTQTQLAYGAGRWNADQDEDIQSILWGYYYTTVGDDRVREEHAEIDGVTLPKDDPFWERAWPPNGWNCRCAVISLFEPAEIVEPPDDWQPDEGFGFNPGAVLAAFNPDQPRDESGRWTGGDAATQRIERSRKRFTEGGGTVRKVGLREARKLAKTPGIAESVAKTLQYAKLTVLVAEKDGVPVAAINYVKDSGDVFIRDLFADKETKGAGTALLATVADMVAKDGYMSVGASVNDAYWGAVGFEAPQGSRSFTRRRVAGN